MIYLHHAKHGVKIATMELEAQYDETNGWVRFDPDDMDDLPPEATEPEPLIADEEAANVLIEPRRRGRPRVAKSE
jgi:hypothetical protein